MSVNILSFLSALIWASLFVVLTYFLRKMDVMKKYYGATILIFLYGFCIFRILFPVEFAFTKEISSEKIYAFFFHTIYLNKIKNISILLIISIVFATVALYKIVIYIVLYNKIKVQLLESKIDASEKEINILNEIKYKSNKNLDIIIYKNNNLNTPIGVGLFKKVIMLPNMEYTDSELKYILLHEYTHFLNNDIFVKIMTIIFCDIFWWNFIVQLLKKDIEQLLEVKCDLKVVENMNNTEKAEYLSIILKTLKNGNKDTDVENISTALVKNKDNIYIKERFTSVMNYNKNDKSKIAKSIAIASTLLITILSYSFILQPSYEAPEGDGSITNENSYILKTIDGKYYLYVDNIVYEELEEDTAKIFNETGISIREEQR